MMMVMLAIMVIVVIMVIMIISYIFGSMMHPLFKSFIILEFKKRHIQ